MVKRDKFGRFVKKSIPWNNGTKGIMKANKTSFKKGHPYGKRFKKGHNTWNKNKNYDELFGEEKAKKKIKEMSLRNKDKTYEEIYGSKEKAKKIKRKIGLKSIGKKKPKFAEFSRLKKGKTCEEIYGVLKAKEIRKKISLGKQNPSEETRKKLRKNRAKQIFPIKDTKIEVKIQNFLKTLEIEFFTHQKMNIKHTYQCDILIPSMNLVIECDGDFIHCNPAKYTPDFIRYPNSKSNQPAYVVWERDRVRTKELIEKGFKVLRLWGSEIEEMNVNEFKNKITSFK